MSVKTLLRAAGAAALIAVLSAAAPVSDQSGGATPDGWDHTSAVDISAAGWDHA